MSCERYDHTKTNYVYSSTEFKYNIFALENPPETNTKKIVLFFSIIGQKKQAGQIDDRLPLISLHQESTTTKVLSSKNSWKAEYH